MCQIWSKEIGKLPLSRGDAKAAKEEGERRSSDSWREKEIDCITVIKLTGWIEKAQRPEQNAFCQDR
jgi:hypothetical protein